MKKYNVTITATVTKTYQVTGENEQAAIEQAHEIFSVLNDGTPESYDQETTNVEATQ